MRVVLHYTTAFKTDYENDYNRMHMAMDIELKKIQYYIEGMIMHINIDDWKRKYAIDKPGIDLIFLKVSPDQEEIEEGTVYISKYFG